MAQVHPFSTLRTRSSLINRHPPPQPPITLLSWVDGAPYLCVDTVYPAHTPEQTILWLCMALDFPCVLSCVFFLTTRASVHLCSVVPVARSSSLLTDNICANVQHCRCLSCVQRSCGLLTLTLTHSHSQSRMHTHPTHITAGILVSVFANFLGRK